MCCCCDLQSEVLHQIQDFLTKYGFRCVDELKLESKTLHDDPGTVEICWSQFSLVVLYLLIHTACTGFVLDAVAGYIRTGSYSIDSMEKREKEIREKAEAEVATQLPFHKRVLFNWVLFHARRGAVSIQMLRPSNLRKQDRLVGRQSNVWTDNELVLVGTIGKHGGNWQAVIVQIG